MAKVLVVDDAALMRVRAARVLEEAGHVVETLRAGAKDFVLKPFQPDRVLAAVQKLLAA